jgi:hypothetical protein
VFHIPKQSVTKAFDDYREFRNGIRGWDKKEDGTLEMYKNAKDAFNNKNPQSFKQVYDALLSKWGVRRGGKLKDSDSVFDIMSNNLDECLRNRSLSELTPKDWPIIRGSILQMQDVKPLEDGISIMAISKFLHFWNAKLFVICDRTVMEQFVFGHKWLMKQRDSMDIGQYPDKTKDKDDKQVSNYLKLLSLSSNLIKSNRSICGEFARTIREISTESQVANDIETYEARAIEWFFIGLAESRPSWWKNARCL